jgi:hypothetical protein
MSCLLWRARTRYSDLGPDSRTSQKQKARTIIIQKYICILHCEFAVLGTPCIVNPPHSAYLHLSSLTPLSVGTVLVSRVCCVSQFTVAHVYIVPDQLCCSVPHSHFKCSNTISCSHWTVAGFRQGDGYVLSLT